MLPRLEALLRAPAKIVSFQLLDNDPLDETHFLLTIRCELISGHTLQTRIRPVAGVLRYSYQEFTDKPLQHWDNAPHFPQLSTFPHHHHDLYGSVIESSLVGDPMTDLPLVLNAL